MAAAEPVRRRSAVLLTDEVLLHYQRCARRPYLDAHGDPQQRDPEREFLQKLRRDSQQNVAAALAGLDCHQPQASDWPSQARETQALMRQGVARIHRGVLSPWALAGEPDPGDPVWVSTPTLLVKTSGPSAWGDWAYEPVDVRFGQRSKPEYRVVAAFQALVLTAVQGSWPARARLILRQQKQRTVDLAEWVPRMQALLEQCRQMLRSGQEPEVFIARQRCDLCHWYGFCHGVARAQRHLSLLPGVTPARYALLHARNITTPEGLTAAPLGELAAVLGRDRAAQLQQQARAHLRDCALPKASAKRVARELPTAATELCFDIEAEPKRGLDYLFGVLRVDRATGTEQFRTFVAERPEQEGQAWHQFLAYIGQYPDAPIFHYSEYEPEACRRLAQRYATPRGQLDSLLARMVDLHRLVAGAATLPVERYSLKAIAQWLGFRWRDPEGSGDRSICWYDRWLSGGDRRLLEAIQRYNEDDCRATYRLKHWLADFLARQAPGVGHAPVRSSFAKH